MKYEQESNERRLLVDFSVASLKRMLLHVAIIKLSIPTAHTENLKENHETI